MRKLNNPAEDMNREFLGKDYKQLLIMKNTFLGNY